MSVGPSVLPASRNRGCFGDCKNEEANQVFSALVIIECVSP